MRLYWPKSAVWPRRLNTPAVFSFVSVFIALKDHPFLDVFNFATDGYIFCPLHHKKQKQKKTKNKKQKKKNAHIMLTPFNPIFIW